MIVNGDISSPQKAKAVLEQTGADGLMIGRGALGNPWLFRQIDTFIRGGQSLEEPTPKEVFACMLKHVQDLHAFYGEELGMRIARKHVSWYEEKFPYLLSLRASFNQLQRIEAQIELLKICYQ